MDDVSTSGALEPIFSQFNVQSGATQVDIREAVALVDFHFKLIYTVVIAFSRRPQSSPLILSPVPGFGLMLSVVREGAKLSSEIGTPWIREFVTSWSSSAVAAVDQFKAPKYKGLKDLRDRLSHGQPLPNKEEVIASIRAELMTLIGRLEENLRKHLLDTTISTRDGRVYINKKKERAAFEVSPLWIWPEEPKGLRIYSHASSDSIQYLEPNGDIWTERRDEEVIKFIKTYIGNSKNNFELGRLVKDVVSDIAAYTEDYSKPSYFFGDDELTGTLYVPWTRSTSAGNEPRIDAFRVGPDNRREWNKDFKEWVAYSDFLKNISNWQILARRIAIGIESFISDRESEESSRLGSTPNSSARGPSLLRKRKDTPSSANGGEEEFDLATRIDESCQRMKPSTSVYFLIGQAGLGKTDLMVTLAKSRATNIASNPESLLPLYLFVSSTGRTLSSLEDAVNSALNITKVLSSQSAKALCRNGLLVLLVDGFDELLGSSGYENALGSLEPWFRELGGRGVLVASARSSYYLTQYRRSLAQATDLNVDHTLAELQPWSKSDSERYLRDMGLSNHAINEIRERDWKILSVPFFAKAFAAWLMRNNETDNASPPSIYDVVVEQYLEREESKLTDPNVGALLKATELRELFSEAAELMQESRNREIEQFDLTACAQSVVGASDLDTVRPGLNRRLSSICGLGVTTDSNGQNQFAFSHEVLFDCFLSLAIQKRVSGIQNTDSLLRLLSISKVNSSVFEWLVEKKPEDTERLAKKLSFKVKNPKDSQVLSANLGALWEALLIRRNGIPVSEVASGLQLEMVNLSKEGWTKLDLSESTIDHLEVPHGPQGVIDISGAQISFLGSKSAEQARRHLIGAESANIHSVHIGEYFGDGRLEVRDILEKAQLIRPQSREGNHQQLESVEYFLERLARRSDIPVILDREELTADDQRLGWINHADAEDWRFFVNALLNSEVARLERIPTSGRPKVRLCFNKPVASLIDPTSDPGAEVIKFWDQF